MDRKGFLILFVAVGALLTWHFGYYLPWDAEYKRKVAEYKQEQDRIKEAQKTATETPDSTANLETPAPKPGDPAPVNPTNPAATANQTATPAPAPEVAEETFSVTSPAGSVDYLFSNLGGGISKITLKDHRSEDTMRMVLNEFGNIPTGALAIKPGDPTEVRAEWKRDASKEAEGVVIFTRRDEAKQVEVTKTYTLPKTTDLKGEYSVHLKIDTKNVGASPLLQPDYYIHTGSVAPIHQRDARHYIGFQWFHGNNTTFETVDWFSAGGMLFWRHEARPVFEKSEIDVTWTGVVNQYFTSMITAVTDEKLAPIDRAKHRGKGVWAVRTDIPVETWTNSKHSLSGSNPLQRVDSAMQMPGFEVAIGATVSKEFQIYAGPREYRRLRLLDNNESEAMQYGSFLGIPTGPFSKLLLNMLNWFYSWCKNYAVAIVLLTILVKSILWPLQNRATRQMKKMALLQPQIKELQDKYKSDPMKFQQEMGRLWKSYGVNPLSGCWPMFLQIPIFVGFYNMLDKAVEIRDHGFLWVKDLASPDTIATLMTIPINPLPICMAATMFLQMKMSPQTGDPAQRKIFMFMPLIFIFICYNFASALALYWTVQNILSIIQLLVTKNQDEISLQKVTVIPPPAKRR